MGALMGCERKQGELLLIEIDHKQTRCKNISANHSLMAMAVKRTGTNSRSPQLVPTHFVKHATPGHTLEFDDDYDITDQQKVAEADGMEYAVFAWPCSAGAGDPRQGWLPEVCIIKHEPAISKYFPTVTFVRQAQSLPSPSAADGDADGDAERRHAIHSHFDGLAQIVDKPWESLLDGQYAVDLTTRDFDTDKAAPGSMKSWVEIVSKADLDPSTELFCVATWGVGPLSAFPDFYPAQSSIFHQLATGQVEGLVGCSGGGGLVSGWGVKAETVTVWRERRHMAAFFESDLHQNPMRKLAGRITFRVRRLWILPEALPASKDTAGTTSFWQRVKNNEFKEAMKAHS